jgi:hypothetical protein
MRKRKARCAPPGGYLRDSRRRYSRCDADIVRAMAGIIAMQALA